MIEIDTSSVVGSGSNSIVYDCTLNGMTCAAKVPHNPRRFISCVLQTEAFLLCKEKANSFIVPEVVLFEKADVQWGEVLVMEKLNSVYPVDFLMRTSMMDREYLIACVAEAIAELHNMGISGFDVEFYWSYVHRKLALLDLGPRYSVGYSGEGMIEAHFNIIKRHGSRMALWNIVSELLETKKAISLFPAIMKGEYIPDINELKDAVSKNATQEHTKGVARNHYLQLIGDVPDYAQEKYVRIFLRKYRNAAKTIHFHYVTAFNEAFRNQIRSNTAYLYNSRFRTASKMSNTVHLT